MDSCNFPGAIRLSSLMAGVHAACATTEERMNVAAAPARISFENMSYLQESSDDRCNSMASPSFLFPRRLLDARSSRVRGTRQCASWQIRSMRSRDWLQLDAPKILYMGLEWTKASDLLEFRRLERPLTGDFIHGGVSGSVADRDEPSGRKPAGTREQIGKMRVLVPGVEGGLMVGVDIDPDDMDKGLVGHHGALKPDECRRRGAPHRASLRWRRKVQAE